MSETRLERQGSPTGWKRKLFRAPIPLYRSGFGFLFGKRFIMLEHTGRNSGEKRRTILEVVDLRPDAVYVAAAWGAKAQWLRNVRADPRVTVYLSSKRFDTVAEVVDADTARRVLGDYADAHPGTYAKLARFMVDNPGATTEEQVDQVAASVPLVRLPRPS